jgi:hypothetical protein
MLPWFSTIVVPFSLVLRNPRRTILHGQLDPEDEGSTVL